MSTVKFECDYIYIYESQQRSLSEPTLLNLNNWDWMILEKRIWMIESEWTYITESQ